MGVNPNPLVCLAVALERKDLEMAGMHAKRTGRYVAAICPQCGGHTMFHGDPTGDTARDWMRMAYVVGELIVFWKNVDSLGVCCPQSERPLAERTCGA